MRSGGRHVLGVVGICVLLCGAGPARAASAPQLGSATSFAILGGSAVMNQGPTTITGNVGVSPGKAVDGLGADAVQVGAIYHNDTLARQAQRDAATASAELTHGTCVALAAFPSSLPPGVYCVASSAMPMTGTLTLDAGGDAEGVWIFRVSDLATAADASVVVANGGHDRNVFWQVAGTATLGERTAFAGNILAGAITLRKGATLSGRALARMGAVLLDGNKISLCCELITILQAGLPPASVGVSYPQQQFAASGGTGVYTFATMDGTLPPGLTLTAGGTLSGTPLTKGRFAFSVTATDTRGCSGTRAYTIEVACVTPIVLSPAVLPGGTAGSPYTAVITANGTESATFQADPTKLPPGLSLTDAGLLCGTPAREGQSDTVLLCGTPTLAGQYTFDVSAEDTISHCAGKASYTVTIAPPPPPVCTIAIAPETLPTASVGVSYPLQQLMASGGTGVFYTFATMGGPLPPGLTLTAGGKLYGTPLTKGNFAFSVTATDTLGCSGTRAYTIEVNCVTPIVLSPAVLPGGTVGTQYNAVITASGTSSATFPPPTNLPPGLSLTTVAGKGLLSGRPTLAEQYTFVVTAEDTISHCAGSATYTVRICPQIAIFPTLPDGFIGIPYSENVVAIGGTAPYTFDLVSGSLPPGFDPFANGTVSGTPTASGVFTFRVHVTDANGCTGEGDVTIVIDPAPLIGTDIDALSALGIALLCGALALAGFRRSLG